MLTMRIAVTAVAVAFSAGIWLPASASADPSDTHGKGGTHTNRYNAQGCQQGGYETRVDAETRTSLNNAGRCASHTARGGTLGAADGAVTFTGSTPYQCPSPETSKCWGKLEMSGVPTNTFVWITMSGDSDWDGIRIRPDSSGNYSGDANVPCILGAQGLPFTATIFGSGSWTPPVNPPNCE